MNDITSKNNTPTTIRNESQSIISIIGQMAQNDAVDPAKMQQMLDMQERIMAKQAEIDFNQAMARLQPRLPQIHKSSKAHNSKYAKYEEIDKAIRPLYSAEGFSLSFNSTQEGNIVTYYGKLSHASGHSIVAQMNLPADKSGSKNDIQAIGSTISYAKRYLVSMLLNIVFTDEDDDGHAGATAFLTDDQLSTLRSIMHETGTIEATFCQWLKVGSLANLPASEFERARNALMTKKQKVQQ